MKRRIFYLFFLALILSSCSGILWDGNEKNELTIALDNPFYQPTASSSSSRALALQGKYLYIELALIEDQAGYNSDNDKLMTGNGVWGETAWGGHAIVTLNLNSWVETVEATFVDVPRGQDLKARVLLDVDEQSVIDDLLFEMDPLSQTYNPDGVTFEDRLWVDILSGELSENLIGLLIRPLTPQNLLNPIDTVEGVSATDVYIDSGPVYTDFTEPLPGNTRFNSLSLDIQVNGGFPVKDVVLYTLVEASFSVSTTLPAYTMLYEDDGSPVSIVIGDSFNINPLTDYRSLMFGYPEVDASYLSDELFIGSTVFTGPDLTTTNYVGGSYDVTYGIIYDEFPSTISGFVTWTLPTGILDTDLDFRIFQMEATSYTYTDLMTVNQIYSLPFASGSDSGWISGAGNSYDTQGTISEFSGQFIIILAKPAGSDPDNAFIFGRIANGV